MPEIRSVLIQRFADGWSFLVSIDDGQEIVMHHMTDPDFAVVVQFVDSLKLSFCSRKLELVSSELEPGGGLNEVS